MSNKMDKNPHREVLGREVESDEKRVGPRASLDMSQPIIFSLQEPQVQVIVENKLIDFLVDTEATHC